MLAESDRQLVEQLKQLLLERGVPLLETIVFGSRARGDAEEDSDLDVLVVVEHRDREMRERISDCAWEVGFEAGLIVQSVVMTRDEIENSPQRSSLLMGAVRKEGVKV